MVLEQSPPNGRIDDFWSDNNERALPVKLDFALSAGKIRARVTGIYFYTGGTLMSATLWPGETIRIQTPIGEMAVSTGFSLYENGCLKSVEPARPTGIETPLGTISPIQSRHDRHARRPELGAIQPVW